MDRACATLGGWLERLAFMILCNNDPQPDCMPRHCLYLPCQLVDPCTYNARLMSVPTITEEEGISSTCIVCHYCRYHYLGSTLLTMHSLLNCCRHFLCLLTHHSSAARDQCRYQRRTLSPTSCRQQSDSFLQTFPRPAQPQILPS